jgi:uncharacterized protein YdhG (YjbR/CyaY superfamily)
MVAIGYLDPTDKSYAWQKKGSEILNQVLVRHPNHPGVAHYIIHSVDYPSLAELGLKAARAYASIAPDSPHALHMPSHIFTRLGLWDDSIASNTASTKSAIAQAQRLHGGGGAFDQLHALDYLVYAHPQQAKDTSARKALAEMEDITRLDENQFAAAYAFAASPARWALERHDWRAAAALEIKPAWFPWNRFRNAEALVYYARAIGAARAGDVAAARRATGEIAAIRRAMPGAQELISYQIPTYKLYGGPVLYFAGWKQHYSLYPATDQLVDALRTELAPYKVNKGTIRFPFSQPVPVKLIERIAKFRTKEAAARARAKRAAPKTR